MENKHIPTRSVILYSETMDDIPKTLEGLYSLFGELLATARSEYANAVVEIEPSDYEYGYGRMIISYERPYTQDEIEIEEAQLEAWRIERESRLVIDEKKMLERLKAKYGDV